MTFTIENIRQAKSERIRVYVNGRSKQVRRIIEWPAPVNDGTCRCMCCGQIDEDFAQDADYCRGVRSLQIDGKYP